MEQGELNHRDLGLLDTDALDLYTVMRLARKLDERLWALNRQGRVAFFVGASGHEAVQVASVFALDRTTDWIVPYYRDLGTVLAWGTNPADVLLASFARAADPLSGGRQLPNHWSNPEARIVSQSSTIATQFPHAVGIAHALKIRRDPGVVVVYGGEGSTSEGDWHEAMNWAAIHRLPLVFIIENNQYAISVSHSEQVGGRIADRAAGYGMAGELIDGNNALDVFRSVRRAATRARAGEGPTLIEAETYRYYAHTSDDDDRLYRSPDEVLAWRRRDPVERFRQYLIEQRILSEALELDIDTEIDRGLSAAVRDAEASSSSTDPFEHVYARPIEPAEPVTPEPGSRRRAGQSHHRDQSVDPRDHGRPTPRSSSSARTSPATRAGVFKATAGVSDAFGTGPLLQHPPRRVGHRRCGDRDGCGRVSVPSPRSNSPTTSIPPSTRSSPRPPASTTARTDAGRAPSSSALRSGAGSVAACTTPSRSSPSTPTSPGSRSSSRPLPPTPRACSPPPSTTPTRSSSSSRRSSTASGRGRIRTAIPRRPARTGGRSGVPGSDLTIVTYGAMTHFSLEAAAALDELGVSVEVIDLRTLRPLDWPTIEASVQKTSRVLVVHEDNEFVGYGAEIAAQIADKAFEWLDAPVRRYGAAEIPAFPFGAELEAISYPNPAGIVMHALELAKY